MFQTLDPLQPWIPHDYTLNPERIDIWLYSLSTIPDNAEALLNPTEHLRAQRYHFQHHKRRFTAARSILRILLSRYQNQPPQDLAFTENAHGKPSLKNTSGLEFNLSHSKDLALLAIGQDHPMGIDLEYLSSRPITGISRLMFSAQECTALDSLPVQLRSLSFFHIWAQKEALIKAGGLGLSYPTQTLTVPHLPITQTHIFDPIHQCTWQLRSFMPVVACCAAVSYHPDVKELRYHILSKEEISYAQ